MAADNPTPCELIDLLGGPAAVARLVEIKSPSVTAWKTAGIRPGRVAELAAATGRKVASRADLVPSGWHRIWPELDTSPHQRMPIEIVDKESTTSTATEDLA
jgi:hypothetical protein